MSNMNKFGVVTIIGRPNVGKSTLLNYILGEKVTIISSKPNTTRTVVKGIKTTKDYQAVFVDTPGIHNARDKINRLMVDQTVSSLSMVDVIYLMMEPDEIFASEFNYIMSLLNELNIPKFLLINKIDAYKRHEIYKMADTAFKKGKFKYVLPISAKKGTNVEKLLSLTVEEFSSTGAFYDEEEITSIPEKFLIAEFVREQVFNYMKDELPYDTLVECESLEEENDKLFASVSIIVKRDSQKGMIIGKQGQNLKNIGKRARQNLKRFFGVPIHLELWVKVKSNWQDSDEYLSIQGL
ncbi:GTP-binding protein Era-like-protein [Flexistipes sinusarabici DSM 4947]|uniref:GTPase Era n=2 Tax=Flexistipes sinusarabici TaxID=2352 RepID=F8E4W0_FLESM|nr:GTP-binding protein Era-like-protein [Flexistipes sinusarabici DSM 4947]